MILHHGARITSTQELLHLGESVHEHKYHCMFINYIKMSLFIHCVYVQEHKILSDWLKSAHISIYLFIYCCFALTVVISQDICSVAVISVR